MPKRSFTKEDIHKFAKEENVRYLRLQFTDILGVIKSTKPSIEDPSNIISLSNTFSNWLTGTSTFLITPKISVNCKRKYLTFSSLANLWMSSLVNERFGIVNVYNSQIF